MRQTNGSMWDALVAQVEASVDRPALVGAIVLLMVTATGCIAVLLWVIVALARWA